MSGIVHKTINAALVKDLVHKCLVNATQLIHAAVALYHKKVYGPAFALLVFADEEIAKADGIHRKIGDLSHISYAMVGKYFQSHKEKQSELALTTYARMFTVFLMDYLSGKIDKVKGANDKDIRELVGQELWKYIKAIRNGAGKEFEAHFRIRDFYYGRHENECYIPGHLQKWRERALYIGIDASGKVTGPFEITEVMVMEYYQVVWQNLYYADRLINEGRLVERLGLKKPPLPVPNQLNVVTSRGSP